MRDGDQDAPSAVKTLVAEFEQIKQSCSKSYSLEILSTDGEEGWQALSDEES